jgi:hypothetical protein
MSLCSIDSTSLSWQPNEPASNSKASLIYCGIKNLEGQLSDQYYISEDIYIVIGANIEIDGLIISPSIVISDAAGAPIFATGPFDDEWVLSGTTRGNHIYEVKIPRNLLNSGIFSISIFLTLNNSNIIDRASNVLTFSVHDDGSDRGEYIGAWVGSIRPHLQWRKIN